MQGANEQEFPRHAQVYAQGGGLELKDDDGVIPKAFKELLSKAASKFMQGEFQDVLKIPAPAYIHYPRSYLENSAVDMSLCSEFLARAAETSDPLERLKQVICCYVGGNHISISQMQLRSPLNPILGETIQRVLPTGERFFAEQVSHHPPITSFLLEGPKDAY